MLLPICGISDLLGGKPVVACCALFTVCCKQVCADDGLFHGCGRWCCGSAAPSRRATRRCWQWQQASTLRQHLRRHRRRRPRPRRQLARSPQRLRACCPSPAAKLSAASAGPWPIYCGAFASCGYSRAPQSVLHHMAVAPCMCMPQPRTCINQKKCCAYSHLSAMNMHSRLRPAFFLWPPGSPQRACSSHWDNERTTQRHGSRKCMPGLPNRCLL